MQVAQMARKAERPLVAVAGKAAHQGGSGADDAEGSFQPTDLGSPFTFTPPASADGTVTTAVYGVLVALPAADAGANGQAVYARLDAIAASFLDPLVQGTRTDPDEGCR